jgi:type IV pilus assembly protein PilM
VGLDIGSSYLKIVQLKERKGGYELAAFEVLQLPPELIVEGSIIDSLRLIDAIKEILKKAKVKTKNAVIGIAGHASVIIRRITLPEMTEEELSESIKFEAEQYVPFDIDDVNIDFQILGQAEEIGQMDVMLVAVKKDIINEYTNVVRETGLLPVVVDVNAFTLANMYEINYEIEPDRNIALVNIGASTINLNIIKEGMTVFTRDSAVGSNVHTEALQKEYSIGYEQAEAVKRGEPVEGVSVAEAAQVISSSSEEIVSEISRSLDYFRSTTYQEEIHEVVLSGGGAMIKDLPTQLAEATGLAVRVAEPFRNIQIPGKFDLAQIEAQATMAAVAVGLALRRPGDR